MKTNFSLKIHVLMILEIMLMFIAWIIIPFSIFLSNKVYAQNKVYQINSPFRHYKRLPSYLRWFETPDDIYLPAGMYEPAIEKINQKYGNFVSSYVWLAFRNVGHGVMWNQGHEVDMHIYAMNDTNMHRNKVFNTQKIIGPFKIIYGYKSVNDWYELKTKYKNGIVGLWAVPRITIRFKKQD